jgi:Glycosyltransferase WbsX
VKKSNGPVDSPPKGPRKKEVVRHTATGAIVSSANLVPPPATVESDVRLIAFYLPQFHPIPENDLWWGKGFTEWHGVAAARPLFASHYQPHLPADLGFYDLRLPEVRTAQAELARKYGIHGFCYHYYWFSGRRVLQRPLDEMLQSNEPDFPFCICWANELWSRRWDGSESEVLIAQEHDLEIDKKLILDLLPLFSDRRYIKVDGKPLMMIYRIGLLPDPQALFAAWRDVAIKHDFPGLHICMAETFGFDDPFEKGCDAAVEFPPHRLVAGRLNETMEGLSKDYSGSLYSYGTAVMNDIVAMPADYPRYKCVMPGWDNTPRRGPAGNVFHGSTPELYELWLREAIAFTRRHLPVAQRLVFINAWNEWGEGAHIEPDMRFGRQYLEATRRALAGLSSWQTVMAGAKARLPDAKDVLTELEAYLESFETSLKYLSDSYLSLEEHKFHQQTSFVNYVDSVLAPLDVKLNGTCHIERINQFTDGGLVWLEQAGHLQISGWNVIVGHDTTSDTESYMTLIPKDHNEIFTARILQRIPRADVGEYYKLRKEEAAWSGIQSSASLGGVRPGSYALGIDTRIGTACHRTMSDKVIVVAPT